ncbi:DUF305 domain-containing protein [Saccharothrix sp. Mg75]|uniref:DUF305 domain-containing protein n=1 Tax=Saccharothrix sp. Mg75 TaxID=3445357 RepID=UPI003EEBC12D
MTTVISDDGIAFDRDAPPPRAPRQRWVVIATGVPAVAVVGVFLGTLLRAPAPVEPRPGPVDVGFSQDMTAHHQQAVTMSTLARDRTADPEVLQLAFDVETMQIEQIGRMQGWLAFWQQPVTSPTGHMGWMVEGGHGHDSTAGFTPSGAALMPGMATTEELTRLRGLAGVEFDVYYLQLMTRHHQGGMSMMEHAKQRASVGILRNFAAQMLVTQRSDIRTMTDMLIERAAAPLPAPR